MVARLVEFAVYAHNVLINNEENAGNIAAASPGVDDKTRRASFNISAGGLTENFPGLGEEN